MGEQSDYYIATGNWTTIQEEVNDHLSRGWRLAGNLVVLRHADEDGTFVLYYQALVKVSDDINTR